MKPLAIVVMGLSIANACFAESRYTCTGTCIVFSEANGLAWVKGIYPLKPEHSDYSKETARQLLALQCERQESDPAAGFLVVNQILGYRAVTSETDTRTTVVQEQKKFFWWQNRTQSTQSDTVTQKTLVEVNFSPALPSCETRKDIPQSDHEEYTGKDATGQ